MEDYRFREWRTSLLQLSNRCQANVRLEGRRLGSDMDAPHQGAAWQEVQFRLRQFCFGMMQLMPRNLQGSRLEEWRFWALIVEEIRVWAIGGIWGGILWIGWEKTEEGHVGGVVFCYILVEKYRLRNFESQWLWNAVDQGNWMYRFVYFNM